MPSKSSQWLSANFDAVAKQYPNEWIVADENGVVLHDSDYDVVCAALPAVAQQANKSVGEYAVMRIPAPGIYQ